MDSSKQNISPPPPYEPQSDLQPHANLQPHGNLQAHGNLHPSQPQVYLVQPQQRTYESYDSIAVLQIIGGCLCILFQGALMALGSLTMYSGVGFWCAIFVSKDRFKGIGGVLCGKLGSKDKSKGV